VQRALKLATPCRATRRHAGGSLEI